MSWAAAEVFSYFTCSQDFLGAFPAHVWFTGQPHVWTECMQNSGLLLSDSFQDSPLAFQWLWFPCTFSTASSGQKDGSYFISISCPACCGLRPVLRPKAETGNSFSTIVPSECWFLSRLTLVLVIFQCFQVVIYLYCILVYSSMQEDWADRRLLS